MEDNPAQDRTLSPIAPPAAPPLADAPAPEPPVQTDTISRSLTEATPNIDAALSGVSSLRPQMPRVEIKPAPAFGVAEPFADMHNRLSQAESALRNPSRPAPGSVLAPPAFGQPESFGAMDARLGQASSAMNMPTGNVRQPSAVSGQMVRGRGGRGVRMVNQPAVDPQTGLTAHDAATLAIAKDRLQAGQQNAYMQAVERDFNNQLAAHRANVETWYKQQGLEANEARRLADEQTRQETQRWREQMGMARIEQGDQRLQQGDQRLQQQQAGADARAQHRSFAEMESMAKYWAGRVKALQDTGVAPDAPEMKAANDELEAIHGEMRGFRSGQAPTSGEQRPQQQAQFPTIPPPTDKAWGTPAEGQMIAAAGAAVLALPSLTEQDRKDIDTMLGRYQLAPDSPQHINGQQMMAFLQKAHQIVGADQAGNARGAAPTSRQPQVGGQAGTLTPGTMQAPQPRTITAPPQFKYQQPQWLGRGPGAGPDVTSMKDAKAQIAQLRSLPWLTPAERDALRVLEKNPDHPLALPSLQRISLQSRQRLAMLREQFTGSQQFGPATMAENTAIGPQPPDKQFIAVQPVSDADRARLDRQWMNQGVNAGPVRPTPGAGLNVKMPDAMATDTAKRLLSEPYTSKAEARDVEFALSVLNDQSSNPKARASAVKHITSVWELHNGPAWRQHFSDLIGDQVQGVRDTEALLAGPGSHANSLRMPDVAADAAPSSQPATAGSRGVRPLRMNQQALDGMLALIARAKQGIGTESQRKTVDWLREQIRAGKWTPRHQQAVQTLLDTMKVGSEAPLDFSGLGLEDVGLIGTNPLRVFDDQRGMW